MTTRLHRHFCGTRPSPQQRFQHHSHPCVAGRRTTRERPLAPAPLSVLCVLFQVTSTSLTSMSTKLGTGSSSSDHHPVVNAPVALPGLTKNLPSISYASNLCVPPHSRMSTSICRAAINRLSPSPGGMMVWPCVNPIRSDPCVTTFERARLGASTSKSPLTICKSGAPRRNSYVSLSVMLPRQRIWPILPGARSFLNYVVVRYQRELRALVWTRVFEGMQIDMGTSSVPWRVYPIHPVSV